MVDKTTLWNVVKNPINRIYNFPSTTLPSLYNVNHQKNLFSSLSKIAHSNLFPCTTILNRLEIQPSISNNQLVPIRNLTKYSLRKGKRKSVGAVLKRFYRLNWGIWIHGKCGRNKKLFKKSSNRRRRLRQHVFCNASQSWLLDKMVTKFWRKPNYYIDDPYEPYHRREEFYFTRKKPVIPENV